MAKSLTNSFRRFFFDSLLVVADLSSQNSSSVISDILRISDPDAIHFMTALKMQALSSRMLGKSTGPIEFLRSTAILTLFMSCH